MRILAVFTSGFNAKNIKIECKLKYLLTSLLTNKCLWKENEKRKTKTNTKKSEIYEKKLST